VEQPRARLDVLCYFLVWVDGVGQVVVAEMEDAVVREVADGCYGECCRWRDGGGHMADVAGLPTTLGVEDCGGCFENLVIFGGGLEEGAFGFAESGYGRGGSYGGGGVEELVVMLVDEMAFLEDELSIHGMEAISEIDQRPTLEDILERHRGRCGRVRQARTNREVICLGKMHVG
jgi:hypothetical protein